MHDTSYGKHQILDIIEGVSENTPSLYNDLERKLNPNQDDVIIVGSGDTKEVAEMGAIMAAIELLKKK